MLVKTRIPRKQVLKAPGEELEAERRSEQRLRYFWPIWYSNDGNLDIEQGRMLDLCSGGLSFLAPVGDYPEPGDALWLRSSYPVVKNGVFGMASFTTMGRVLRNEELSPVHRDVAGAIPVVVGPAGFGCREQHREESQRTGDPRPLHVHIQSSGGSAGNAGSAREARTSPRRGPRPQGHAVGNTGSGTASRTRRPQVPQQPAAAQHPRALGAPPGPRRAWSIRGSPTPRTRSSCSSPRPGCRQGSRPPSRSRSRPDN